MKRILSLVLACIMLLSVAAVSASAELTYAPGTVLRMATGYNNAKTGLTFDPSIAGEGITLADGKTYNSGDFKPTWVAVMDKLGFAIENKYQGNGAGAEFDYWKEQLDQVDVLSGTAAKLTEAGEAGLIVNIAEYLDDMPNFKAYLDANPIVKLSITGNTDTGAIYFSPYFDGVDDIERMPLMRVDWVVKLLDGEGEFTADACNNTAAPVYTPYMPLTGKIEIETPNLEGTATEIVTKDYDAAGNIVALMNEKGSISGVEAVNMLREYIDKAYNGYYGTARSNLFIGQNAAWDVDELVALLRCVVANPQTLNGTDNVQGIFSREDANNQRRVDMMRLAGHLFGVRGLESRQDYLYVSEDGELHDARQEVATYEAMAKMHTLAEEGLISSAFINSEDVKTQNYLEQDLGFMHYDYNQTQTLYNKTALDNEAGEKYMAVMVPVARWYDGANEEGVYMRFTESWRSVKTDGWGISKAGVAGNDDKLYAALALIDYAYSEEGTILMSYGPDAFIKTNADGSYVTFLFNGKEMPEIADATREELWAKASGNYTNYARQFLGSTLSFMKSQAFEYQCTHDVGREGAGKISTAIALGTIKHPLLAVADNPWYTSVPTVLPTTKNENQELGQFTDLNSKFQAGKGQENVLVDIIAVGFTAEGMSDPEEAAETVADSWKGEQYLIIKEGAWEALLDYYEEITE
jgi:putative aldouronate transport system substrate-binding protein